ncbi:MULTISPECIES: DUF3224 domain-containing protein [unclassified Duganella]|uniref:DUF3224 domain-containing protein n=1 Tax=unclassified Duganella TaxID=2636909 RepID=UPI000E343979|nr:MULTISPECIES: DUF3224 domain-containing protein [unclassified Duganella]RFP11989.1 DUF3224 domain-containing protein [Duganella sp. BJB475]RFP30000.1 DUF3224 domain-containing protein [Duganella sp. BJB476]
MPKISGEFNVKMAPETMSPVAAESGIGRMSLDKRYHGALDAAGAGEMLAYMDRELGSGAYVAMEKVTGTLEGRRGGFLLHHSGTMERGTAGLKVAVVADSGSGELVGLSGTLHIRIEGGKHYYDFDYTLGDAVA